MDCDVRSWQSSPTAFIEGINGRLSDLVDNALVYFPELWNLLYLSCVQGNSGDPTSAICTLLVRDADK